MMKWNVMTRWTYWWFDYADCRYWWQCYRRWHQWGSCCLIANFRQAFWRLVWRTRVNNQFHYFVIRVVNYTLIYILSLSLFFSVILFIFSFLPFSPSLTIFSLSKSPLSLSLSYHAGSVLFAPFSWRSLRLMVIRRLILHLSAGTPLLPLTLLWNTPNIPVTHLQTHLLVFMHTWVCFGIWETPALGLTHTCHTTVSTSTYLSASLYICQ